MDWIIWLGIAVALAVGEAFTLTFFLLPAAAGAGVAAVVGGVGLGLGFQLLAFLIVTVASVIPMQRLARSHRKAPPQIRTGTAALIGQGATVTERIDNHGGTGYVKLAGETWTARSYIDGDVFEAGARVSVVEIRGATALVTE